MSQSLPFTPQLPSLDGRLPVSRERPADGNERSTQRQAFSRLLDRFTRNEHGQDSAKDVAPAAQSQHLHERRGTAEDGPRPHTDTAGPDPEAPDEITVPTAPTQSATTPTDPATPTVDPAPVSSIPAPTAVSIATVVPTVAATPTEAVPAAIDSLPAAPTTPGAAALDMTAANEATLAPGTPATAATSATAKPVSIPAAPVADAAAAEAAMAESAAASDFATLAQPTARTRRPAAADGGEPTAKSANAATSDKPVTEIVVPQVGRITAAQAEAAAPVVANSNQAAPQVRGTKGDAGGVVLEATALAGAGEDRANAPGGADQAVASLTGIDSPRRTAALYHKVADAARPGADAPAPADQIAIRLIHAVADGRRAIQMHLHPAELGSIDVKMQWQGDKLTAQFTVDRPETLQILQRDVPALERSLGQAGVNVDSGSLSFSLRQQQGNGRNGGEGFAQVVADAGFDTGGEPMAGDEMLGQVIRDGILSIRV